jgi:hypothetical protein
MGACNGAREQIGKLAQRARPVHASDVEIGVPQAPDPKEGRIDCDEGNVGVSNRLERPPPYGDSGELGGRVG